MFDRAALGRFKSMQSSAARDSAEANRFLRLMDQKTKIDLAPFEPGDAHVGWQAYANVLSCLRGTEIAVIDLMFAFSTATRGETGASFKTISAIASGIIFIQTQDGRFDELLEFIKYFSGRFPGNLFAATSLMKCRINRGEIEHAEFILRNSLGPCSTFEMAREFVYWAYALFNHDDILPKLDDLRRKFPTLWQNPSAAAAIELLGAVAKRGRAESREDSSTVHGLNLPGDTGGWRRVEAASAKLELRLSRIEGVRADHLPMALGDGFVSRRAEAGQVGCFLAHMKARETWVGRKFGKALIVGDDASPMFTFSWAFLLDARTRTSFSERRGRQHRPSRRLYPPDADPSGMSLDYSPRHPFSTRAS